MENDAPAYQVRMAYISDAPALSALIKSSMRHYCADSGIQYELLESTHESLAAVENRITKHTCLCLTDEDDNIWGTVTLSFSNNPLKYSFSHKTEGYLSKFSKCAYISRFAVDASLRGTGLGTLLLNRANEIVKHSDCNLVLLHTALTNRERCEYYSNRGYSVLDFEDSRGYPRGLFYLLLD